MKKVNAVVIGAGAGGGVVAKELAVNGMSVVLLERGLWYTAADCRKDDLRNQRTSALGKYAFGPDDERQPACARGRAGQGNGSRCQRNRLQQQRSMRRRRNLQLLAGQWLGVLWKRTSGMRSTYGRPVNGSTLDDWPISYQDLEPHDQKAEWELGVSGDDSGNPFKAPRSKPMPMPPFPPNREHQVLQPPAPRNSASIRSTFPCSATRFPTMTGGRACAAAGAWDSPAK